MAAIRQMTVGSLARTAAMRSAVNVAIPHRRGTADATKAMRMPPPRRVTEPMLVAQNGEARLIFGAGLAECPLNGWAALSVLQWRSDADETEADAALAAARAAD